MNTINPVSTVKSKSFAYDHPKLNYTDEQYAFLGLGDDRFHNDTEIPQSVVLGGIKPVMLAPWKKCFNPVAEAPALNKENPDAVQRLYVEEPVFKPITDLNRRKKATRDAILKCIELLESAGNEIAAIKLGTVVHTPGPVQRITPPRTVGELTEYGAAKRSWEITIGFVESAVKGIIFPEFEKNSDVMFDAWKTLSAPPEEPKTPQEAIVDVEIRSIYRDNENIRKRALIGDISLRHDLAITRGESFISGFTQESYDIVFFAAAVRKSVKEAHQMEMLYAINNTLWLFAYRAIVGLAEMSNHQMLGGSSAPIKDVKQDLLNSLGLNWHGNNMMSTLDYARNMIETSVKQEENLNSSERLKLLSERAKNPEIGQAY